MALCVHQVTAYMQAEVSEVLRIFELLNCDSVWPTVLPSDP